MLMQGYLIGIANPAKQARILPEGDDNALHCCLLTRINDKTSKILTNTKVLPNDYAKSLFKDLTLLSAYFIYNWHKVRLPEFHNLRFQPLEHRDQDMGRRPAH